MSSPLAILKQQLEQQASKPKSVSKNDIHYLWWCADFKPDLHHQRVGITTIEPFVITPITTYYYLDRTTESSVEMGMIVQENPAAHIVRGLLQIYSSQGLVCLDCLTGKMPGEVEQIVEPIVSRFPANKTLYTVRDAIERFTPRVEIERLVKEQMLAGITQATIYLRGLLADAKLEIENRRVANGLGIVRLSDRLRRVINILGEDPAAYEPSENESIAATLRDIRLQLTQRAQSNDVVSRTEYEELLRRYQQLEDKIGQLIEKSDKKK